MIKELILMTKDIPAVITEKYAVIKFYIEDKKSRSDKTLIISEYVTAKDYKTGELIEIGFTTIQIHQREKLNQLHI